MMLMGENSHAVAERVAEKGDENSKTAAAASYQSGVQQENLSPNDSHGDDEPFRRGVAGHGGAAVAPRKLARRTDRCHGDSAGFLFALTGMTRFGISGN
jgi:hypothetical protein